MTESFVLKRISPDAIDRAVARAEHYRLLNDPEQAESICLDILAVDDANERARITLVLAITDQFKRGIGSRGGARAMEHVAKLSSEYDRAYYSGLVSERQGRAHLLHGGIQRTFAYEELRDAMHHYQKADALKPTGVDDAILRWNACVRTIQLEGLQPRRDEPELPLE